MLERNPFSVLRATQWDSRQTLMERAADCELRGDESLCREALSRLLNPRPRLGAELGWFPGVRPGEQRSLLRAIEGDHGDLRELAQDVFPLARMNAYAGFLSRGGTALAEEELLTVVGDLVRADAAIEPEAVLVEVNRARAEAGFLPERREDAIGEVLDGQRRELARFIVSRLEERGQDALVQGLTSVAERITARGRRPAPPLLTEVVGLYELAVSRGLEEGRDRILARCRRLEEQLERGDRGHVGDVIQRLSADVLAWDRIAQPVQVVRRAEGQVHRPSMDVALAVRNLSVVVFNRTRNVELARRLNRLLRNAFAELDVVMDQLQEDRAFLDRFRARIRADDPIAVVAALLNSAVVEARRRPARGKAIALGMSHLVSGRLLGQPSSAVMVRGFNLLAGALAEIAEAMLESTGLEGDALDVLDRAFRLAQDADLQQRIIGLMGRVKRGRTGTETKQRTRDAKPPAGNRALRKTTRRRTWRRRSWAEKGKGMTMSFLRGLADFALELGEALLMKLLTFAILMVPFLLFMLLLAVCRGRA